MIILQNLMYLILNYKVCIQVYLSLKAYRLVHVTPFFSNNTCILIKLISKIIIIIIRLPLFSLYSILIF